MSFHKPIPRASPLLLALLLTFTFITIPRHPYLITDALFEKAVLSHAHENHLQFGRDIVFTYGPLGFLTSPYFFAHAASLRMVVDFLFCFGVALGVCLTAWRMALFWRCLFVAMFALLASNIEPRSDLLLDIGLLCWGLLAIVESGRWLLLAASMLALLASFAVLVKLNFLAPAGLTIAMVASDFALRRKSLLSLGIVVGSAGALPAGWMIAGQEVSNLPRYLAQLFPIASGYNAVVVLNAIEVLNSRGKAVLLIVLLVVILRVRHQRQLPLLRRALLLPWLLGLLFLVWKHGFVRADLFHMGFFFGFTPILILVLEALVPPPSEPAFPEAASSSLAFPLCNPVSAIRYSLFAIWQFILPSQGVNTHQEPNRRALWSRGLSLVCCVLVVFTLQSWFFAGFFPMVFQPFRNFALNFPTLIHPAPWRHQMLDAQQAAFRSLDLSPEVLSTIGRSTVDVFGQDQLYALHNQLNYHPRPVFQSYVAFNPALNRLNHQFYVSSNAPQFVLFHLGPIDHKFPPLEDSFVLRDILCNYELLSQGTVGTRSTASPFSHDQSTDAVERVPTVRRQALSNSSSFLLLRLKTISPPKLTLLQQGTIQLGHQIQLTNFGNTNLWLEVNVRPTFTGGLRQLVNKPSPVRVVVWSAADGSQKPRAAWKAPPPMLSSGFLASPLVLQDSSIVDLYRGHAARPTAYSVEVDPDGDALWQKTIHYRLYRIETPLPSPLSLTPGL